MKVKIVPQTTWGAHRYQIVLGVEMYVDSHKEKKHEVAAIWRVTNEGKTSMWYLIKATLDCSGSTTYSAGLETQIQILYDSELARRSQKLDGYAWICSQDFDIELLHESNREAMFHLQGVAGRC